MKSVILALVLGGLLGACAMQKKEPPPKPFAGTKWVVQLELPVAGEAPWFRFGDGRMEGFGGCNRVTARYVQDTVGARAIAIGRVDRGTRACDPGTQAAELRILEVLQSVSSYTITIDQMTMTGSGGQLKFHSEPRAEIPK
jgi:heat shock protein HslJ